MKLQITTTDSPTAARLKMIYLLPIWIVSLPIAIFIFGVKEYVPNSLRVMYEVIWKGNNPIYQKDFHGFKVS